VIETEPEDLFKTPLDKLHRELGARMVPFAGWSMPVQISGGIISEHLHARSAAGLFDVSHVGQVRLSGPAFTCRRWQPTKPEFTRAGLLP